MPSVLSFQGDPLVPRRWYGKVIRRGLTLLLDSRLGLSIEHRERHAAVAGGDLDCAEQCIRSASQGCIWRDPELWP